ncbi:MAG: hypothetical protein JWQ04_668, partial [Pedosphaera sp.]|nr:hypothetical protein [Pedosphaera sp.]
MGISLHEFKQMKDRLSGSARAASSPSPALSSGIRRAASTNEVVLGVDPSLRG